MNLNSQQKGSQSDGNAHEHLVSGPRNVLTQAKYSQISQVSGDLQQLHDEFFERSNNLAHQLETAKQEIGELKSKLDEKEQIVNKAIKQLGKLDHKFEESQKEIGKLKGQVDESNERASKAIKQSGDLQKEITELKSELAQTRHDKKNIEDHLKQVYENNINKLNTEFANLNQKFETKCQESQELANQIKDSNDQRNQIVKDLNKQGTESYKNKQYQKHWSFTRKLRESRRPDAKIRLGLVSYGTAYLYDKALETVERAIEYDSSDAIFHYNRGTCHEELGDRVKAITDYKKCLEINPNHSHAQYAKTRLAKLEKK